MTDRLCEMTLYGCRVIINVTLGHIAVETGSIVLTWDQLFEIKNQVWGREARAVEVFPRCSELVNTRPCRHLWRLGEDDFCPDLLGQNERNDSLEARHARAWQEACK